MAQVRVPFSALLPLVQALVAETTTFTTVMTRFVVVNAGGGDEEGTEGTEGEGKTKTAHGNAPALATTVERCTRASFSRPTVPLAQQV
jgi:hypothetical protein